MERNRAAKRRAKMNQWGVRLSVAGMILLIAVVGSLERSDVLLGVTH